MIGVEIFLAALMISLMRGTPSVMFIEATPAKWNVLSVICVPGSPIDCAPTAPTAVPGSTLLARYLRMHARRKLSKTSPVSTSPPLAGGAAAASTSMGASSTATLAAAGSGAAGSSSSSLSRTRRAVRRFLAPPPLSAAGESGETLALRGELFAPTPTLVGSRAGGGRATPLAGAPGSDGRSLLATKARSSTSNLAGSEAMVRETTPVKAGEATKASKEATACANESGPGGAVAAEDEAAAEEAAAPSRGLAAASLTRARWWRSVRSKLTGRPSLSSIIAGSSSSSP
mmetsp:Transcript_37049/g.110742  ORF Transcript_37049/g.110742 Transcript_37049/m.110742 type:complete len:287 (-) Transcript_37049:332-1192(-)